MTQIVNARFYRLGVNRSWEASWAAAKPLYTSFLTHDLILFKYIKLFISQYSAPVYFRFPHKDAQETVEENTEGLVINKPVTKKNQNPEIKDEKAELLWKKRLRLFKTKNKQLSSTFQWLTKRRNYRIKNRLSDLRFKIKRINFKLKKQARDNIKKTVQVLDISPQPPIETFAANSRKISGNDRIIYNPFTKIGLVFSHLNIQRQKALILKIFISDYMAYEKAKALSKRFLKQKIRKRLKKLFRRRLSKSGYANLQRNRKNPIITTNIRQGLLINKIIAPYSLETRISRNLLRINSQNKYSHKRVLIRNKTIRKMVPQKIRQFIANREKILNIHHIFRQLIISTKAVFQNRKNRRFAKNKHERTFQDFLQRFVILNTMKSILSNNTKTKQLLTKFIKPVVTMRNNSKTIKAINMVRGSKLLSKVIKKTKIKPINIKLKKNNIVSKQNKNNIKNSYKKKYKKII